MNNLTALEKRVLNNLSRKIEPTVLLGNKIQELITDDGKDMALGTPTNAAKASVVLAVTGVVKDGETVSIGAEVYEFLADVALSKTTATNKAVDINASTVKASGALTMTDQPDSGETVTIGTKVYTFVPVGTATADGEVSVGADVAGARLALVAAINGTDNVNDPHPLVTAAAFVGDACVITALVGGTDGNAIATTETFGAVTNIFAAVTLGSGANCSAANAITALVAAITAVSALVTAEAVNATVVITAKISGILGNAIALAETMANAAFAAAATVLAGGTNGTIGIAGSLMVDASYIYVCIATNTISGSNWRRISLGSAF